MFIFLVQINVLQILLPLAQQVEIQNRKVIVMILSTLLFKEEGLEGSMAEEDGVYLEEEEEVKHKPEVHVPEEWLVQLQVSNIKAMMILTLEIFYLFFPLCPCASSWSLLECACLMR